MLLRNESGGFLGVASKPVQSNRVLNSLVVLSNERTNLLFLIILGLERELNLDSEILNSKFILFVLLIVLGSGVESLLCV